MTGGANDQPWTWIVYGNNDHRISTPKSRDVYCVLAVLDGISGSVNLNNSQTSK